MITKDNFLLYAMKAYDNPTCKTLVEFEEDVAKFSNLVRLTRRDVGYMETHILLNAVVTLLNVFRPEECIEMMFFKVKREDWYKLKTILVYLNRMPEKVSTIDISEEDIPTCPTMLSILNRI